VLVPVGESVTLRNTVAHAIESAIEEGIPGIHFVVPVAWHSIGDVDAAERAEVRALLDRVDAWAAEDAPDGAVAVETAIIGADEYLFSPDDYAAVLAAYAEDHGISRIVVDPEYSPGGNVPLLRPMEVALARRGFDVREAPVETPVRRTGLARAPGGALQFGLLFGVAFLFYHLLSGFAILSGEEFLYELATGTFSAGVVAGALHTVTLSDRVAPLRLVGQSVRFAAYVPYLLYEIVKSNLAITYLVLHPRLPIDPRLTRVRSAVWGGTALTTLANSITLTPGTLTVRTEGQDLYVHGLFSSAREGIADGALERAVRFVFYGREAAAVATPEERGDYEELQGPTADAAPDSDSGPASDPAPEEGEP